MKILAILLSFFLFQATLFAQKSATPKGFTTGKTKKGKYTNKYFDLTIKFNPNWHVNNKKDKKEISKRGADIIGGTEDEKEQLTKVIEQDVYNLLYIQENDPNSGRRSTSSFICMAENLIGTKEGITAEEYINASKSVMAGMDLPYTFDEELGNVKIGNRSFKSMNATLDFGSEVVVHQLYLVDINKGFALSFVCTYVNETERKELMRILKYIQLK